ncbi:MAG: alpha-glucosidase C-terminal domain-containing protein [Rhodocyclaceae bacterium]|nr:alpha-glucosidase C-terminal domain-containing protein [Rhodocyclaceae bacterium]
MRKNYCAFGRGTLKFLEPGNRKILAFVREWENEKILCVVNLSRTAQPVELDLRSSRRACRWNCSAALHSRPSANCPTC